MPPAMPGFVVTAKVRWEGSPELLDAQLFFFAPSLAMHALPCILEEATDAPPEAKNEAKNQQIVKLRLLVPQAPPNIPPKTEFKLQYNPAHVCAEGIIQEDT